MRFNKNVIIIGSSRSGKTTLAKMITKKTEYNIVEIDSLISGIERGFASLKISHNDRSGESSKKLERFLYEYLKSLSYRRYNDIYYVIESSYISLEFVKTMLKQEKYIFIVLGYGELDPQKIFNNIRENDKNYDWTSKLNDNELMAYCKNIVEFNVWLKTECVKYNIKYNDTSNNRKKVLNNIYKEIVELLKKQYEE